MAEANAFLREIYLPRHNARFAVPAEAEGSAFVPFTGSLDDILCIQEGAVTVTGWCQLRVASSFLL